MHLCFMVRTKDLFAQGTPTDRKLYLSGLLVGAELAGAGVTSAASPTVWLVGSAPLCALYDAALAVLGVRAQFDTAADTSAAGIFSASRAAGIIRAPAAARAAAGVVSNRVVPAASARPTTAQPGWWG